MVSIKGNDGRRERDMQNTINQKILLAGGITLAVFLIVWLSANQLQLKVSLPIPLSDIKGKDKPSKRLTDLNLAPLKVPASDKSKISPILEATVHLVNIHVTKIVWKKNTSPAYYDGIEAEFCQLDWKSYMDSPTTVPMYRDLINKSKHCERDRIVVNLRDIVEKVRIYDSHHDHTETTQILDPNFIFHESRCGSTLLGNILAYSDSDTAETTNIQRRVYSEAGPPLSALNICGENHDYCSRETSLQVFQDVIYLMGRVPISSTSKSLLSKSQSDIETTSNQLFFKMQSIATTSLDKVQEAFPKAPWLFVFRDPEEVMVSQLHIRHVERAKCLGSRRHPPHRVAQVIETSNFLNSAHDLTNEEYCAIYLSAICQSALEALQKKDSNGYALQYDDNIISKFVVDVLPNHFNIRLTARELSQIHAISRIYSKARSENMPWTGEDGTEKHNQATAAIHQASNDFLAFSYVQLEILAGKNKD
mmetsp:Transcript_18862/g.28680  ORF Transcript_18862/g.28680 Transcript_18862/m.28680 type:complete len:478 (-) Transcript_18862:242-1675(-)